MFFQKSKIATIWRKKNGKIKNKNNFTNFIRQCMPIGSFILEKKNE